MSAGSEGESEVSDGNYASDVSMSRSASAGPSGVRSRSATSARRGKKRRNLQDIMNEAPGSLFPWDEILFYVPEWVPPIIRQQVLRRIEAAGGQTTEHVQWAHTIISYRAETAAQRKELAQLPSVRAKQAFVLYPDWLARVYFGGRIVDPPRYLVWSNQNPLIAMSDLGDPALNLKTMTALERHGAIVVPLKHAQVLCVADDSPLLGLPDEEIPGALDHVAFMPVAKFWQLLAWARKYYFEKLGEAEEDRIEEEMRRAARAAERLRRKGKGRQVPRQVQEGQAYLTKPAKHSKRPKKPKVDPIPTRPRVSRPADPGSIGYNNETWQTRLSEAERRLLGIWIAYHCPNGKGRTSNTLYTTLVSHQFADPGWTQLARNRSAGAWRDWYRKFYKLEFPDGRSFGDMIEEHVEEIEGMALDEALGRCSMSTGEAAGTASRKRKSDTPFLPAKRKPRLETPAVARARETPARTRGPSTRARETPALARVATRSAARETPTPRRRQLVVEIPRRRSMRPAPA